VGIKNEDMVTATCLSYLANYVKKLPALGNWCMYFVAQCKYLSERQIFDLECILWFMIHVTS